jgi:gliding motility-associated-like protein
LNNLCEGNYTATVIDENGCEDSQSFVIESDEPPTITTLNNLNTCNGSSVELSATIGGSASGISWVSPDGSFSDINSLITIFTPNVSDAIAFVVVTTQSANCGTIQENIFVNVSPTVDPLFSQVSDQCEGATFILNTTSENGVNGVWSPAINNTTSTNYTFTPDAFECANNGSMTITILPSTVSVLNQTVCESELPYTWNGVLFNAAGTQNTTLINTNGCDSLITMNLVVNQTLSSTENVSICSSLLPYTWNGILLNASGTQSMVFSSVESGCDSTASIILNVLPELSSNTIVTICETEVPFEWNGITVSNEGVLNVTLQSVISGCDSIATLDLTIINGSITFIDTSICEDELPYIWNGIELNDSGSETIVIEGSNGCDSMITINLLVHPIPEITLSTLDYVYCSSDTPEAIIFQNVFDEITWFSDENLTQIISNENEFIPLNIIGVTNYFVLATDEGCQSPSQIIVVEFKNCGLVIPTAITPDGDEKNDRWQLDDIDLLYPNNVVSIFNRWGNKIFESQKGLYNQMPWDGSFNNEVLPTASYYFIIEYNDGNTTASNGIVSIVK